MPRCLMSADRANLVELHRLPNFGPASGDYLAKLMARMKALGFPVDDRLFDAANRAWQETSNLVVVASTARAKRPSMERKSWAG